MAKGKKETQGSAVVSQSKSSAIADKGIVTSQDFASFMSALMSDLISGAVSPVRGNAVCNAGSKLLKVVEMQMKYGTHSATNGGKVLFLTTGPSPMAEPQQVAAD